jgi:FAD/FMN-containing dehydrogenase/Fe-S oxidoreductase
MNISQLEKILDGEILTDKASKIMYATDASIYYEEPHAVIIPKNIDDLNKIVKFASKNKLPLIPRAAGTSLAGQVVGNGVVVDISKHINKIIDINCDEKWVKVQPGVILSELNRYLSEFNLFFGPETSTANRCTLGGMVGNNACGLHAVKYGTTRDHILDITGFLSDGSKVVFKPIFKDEFIEKCKLNTLEGDIYKFLNKILLNKQNITDIINNYPEPRIIRRNNGYALDQLIDTDPFANNKKPLNISKLIAGSEGTLMFITEIKLKLVDIPPKETGLVCVHFNNINSALKANIIALKHNVTAVELMDNIVLEASKNNIEQQKNRFFIKDNPKSVLLIEFTGKTVDEIKNHANRMIEEMQNAKLGYHYPILIGDDTKKAWNLRKAGLGIMSNIPGDKKSITVIEDTAVHPDVLPEYIEEFTQIMNKYNEDCVYHAHAGTGEIHLRPRLNLKKQSDIDKFELLAKEIAILVKKYRGSLSGEHGDGRLRGKFIPFMLGDNVFSILKELKTVFDPYNIFNPGKIIDSPDISSNLRYKLGETRNIETILDFSNKLGIVRATESCNGSGDCLKSSVGTMCPSYMATRNEKNSTRARANVLREFLTKSNKSNPFNHKEIYDILDLCLSCKACKSECPSSIDVAKLKAEFLQHWYDANGIPLNVKAIANISKINKIGALYPRLTNVFTQNKITSSIIKVILGFSQKRTIPSLQKTTLRRWVENNLKNEEKYIKEVVLFIDEFTNYNDTDTGINAIRLLTKLRYKVLIVKHPESGRTFISKGLLRSAKKIAIQNVLLFKDIISDNKQLIGIEPSAILSFRDEYPDLVGNELKQDTINLAKNSLLIDEFIANEFALNNISKDLFTNKKEDILLHGHCQQKAIASTKATIKMLSIPENYSVREIPSGCCGMAGSFGYEKKHYDLSMKIGESVLFPAVREVDNKTIIAALGTSCRCQIKDGTDRDALHPVDILFSALKEK